ncbi:MAG: hypothetical protein O3C21_11105 [Verrucomicrobia bacterium]|nr:hypothetical protein [Verrucomicrobiota bacterium]
MRLALRMPLFLVPFAGIHLAALLGLLIEFQWLADSTQSAAFTGIAIFSQPFWGAVSLVLVFILPMRNLGALQALKRQGSFELVLITGLSAARMVHGAWLVQSSISLLVFVSLLPYIIFRYFFGGVEVVETLIIILSVLGASAASSALIIGVSGYANISVRLGLLAVAEAVVVIVGGGAIKGVVDSHSFHMGNFFHLLVLLYVVVSLMLFFAFYTLCGLQLGCAHLQGAIGRPGVSTKPFAAAILISPVLLMAGSLVTCFYGTGLVLVPMVIWIWKMGSLSAKPR